MDRNISNFLLTVNDFYHLPHKLNINHNNRSNQYQKQHGKGNMSFFVHEDDGDKFADESIGEEISSCSATDAVTV